MQTIRWKIVTLYRTIAARKQFRMFNELLFDCATRGLGIRNYENEFVSGEKHFIETVLPQYLNLEKPITFFDVGANEGQYTELLLTKFKTARCVCIEPHPLTFKSLAEKLSSRATSINCALGSNCGTLTLYDRADSDRSEHATLYREIISDIHYQDTISHQVAVKTLDEVAQELDISRIDLLKIDTEGHELEVLRGATKLLSKGAIAVVHIEFNEMNVVSKVFLRDIRKMLPGYTAHRLLPSSTISIPEMPLKSELFGFQNIVFLPN